MLPSTRLATTYSLLPQTCCLQATAPCNITASVMAACQKFWLRTLESDCCACPLVRLTTTALPGPDRFNSWHLLGLLSIRCITDFGMLHCKRLTASSLGRIDGRLSAVTPGWHTSSSCLDQPAVLCPSGGSLQAMSDQLQAELHFGHPESPMSLVKRN
jgi:hypothetical protein